jgi:hypothetical protein
MESIAAITGILVLAALCEALVEYLLGPIAGPLAEKRGDESRAQRGDESRAQRGEQSHLDWRQLVLRYSAVLVGILLCFVYRVDLLGYFNLWSAWPWVGYLITGILIGRGSNFVHDFASRWLTRQAIE